MNIEDLKVGKWVVADLIGIGETEIYQIDEINDDGTVNIRNKEHGEDDVPPDELRPIPDMPEEIFIDLKGVRRVTVRNGQFVRNTFFPDGKQNFFHVATDGLASCDEDLTPDQIALAKTYVNIP